MIFMTYVGVAIAGYAAAIYSWPWIKVQANGISAEAANLRQKAAQLEAKLRSAL